MGYKIEPTGFRMSLTKKCASPCFLCIGFRFYLLVIGFTLWLLGLILAPISIRNADLVLVWSANALLVAGSLLLTLGVTGWILYLWEIELDVRTDLFKRIKQKEARSPDVTKPPSDVNGTQSDVMEMTNGVTAVPVPVPVRSPEPGAANQGNKLPKLRRNRKVESERGDSEKTESDTGTSNNVQSRVHNDVHLNRTSSEMTVPLLAESRQNQKSTEVKTLKTNAAPDARESKPVSGKAGTVTKGLASSKGGPSPKQPSVVPATKQRDPVPVNTTALPLPKGNIPSGNKVSPEPREETPKPNTSQRVEKASKPTVQGTLISEITTPNITQTLLKPTVSPTSKDSIQKSSASTEQKQTTPDDEPVPKRKVSTATIKPTATNTLPKDPSNVSAPTAQKRPTKTKRKMSKSSNVSNPEVSPTSEGQADPKSLGPEVSNAAFVPPNSGSKEIASDPFPTALPVSETQPAVPKPTVAPRKGNKVRESTLSPKGVAAVHKPTVLPMQKQFQVPRSTGSDAGQSSLSKGTIGSKLGLKETVVLPLSPKEIVGPIPESNETADSKHGSKENVGPKPGSKETADSKHGSKENVSPTPGSKETAGLKPRSKENAGPKVVSKETTGPKPMVKEKVVPKPGSEETAGTKPGSKETAGIKPGSKETGGSKPDSKESVGPKPLVKETVVPLPGSKETTDPNPGPKKTAGPKPGPMETASPQPGSKETAGSKPRSKETVGPKPGSKETADRKPGSKATAAPKQGSKVTAVPKSVSKGTVVSKPGSKETDVSEPGSKENEVPKPDSKEPAAKKPRLKEHTAVPKETDVLKSVSKGVVSKLGSSETDLTRSGSKENAVPTPGSEETAAPKRGSEETVVPKPGSKEGSPGSSAEMAPVSDELRMPSGSKPKDPNLDDPKTQINKGSESNQKKTVKTAHMNGVLRSTDQKLPPGKGQTRGLSGTRQKSGKVTKDKLKNRPKSKKGTARPAVNSAELKKVMVEARAKWGPTRGTDNCLAVLAIGQNANGKKVEKGDSDKQEKPRRVSVTCPEPSGSPSTPTSTHAKDITKVSI